MIQRIQNILILIDLFILIFIIKNCKFAYLKMQNIIDNYYNIDDISINIIQKYYLHNKEIKVCYNSINILILSIILLSLYLIVINYKNHQLQIIICYFNIITTLMIIFSCIINIITIVNKFYYDIDLKFGNSIYLLILYIIILFISIFYIKKDDKAIKSMNNIR